MKLVYRGPTVQDLMLYRIFFYNDDIISKYKQRMLHMT
jgi:hypothetical protein